MVKEIFEDDKNLFDYVLSKAIRNIRKLRVYYSAQSSDSHVISNNNNQVTPKKNESELYNYFTFSAVKTDAVKTGIITDLVTYYTINLTPKLLKDISDINILSCFSLYNFRKYRQLKLYQYGKTAGSCCHP